MVVEPGTKLSNAKIRGEKVLIQEGPFKALVDLPLVQVETEDAPPDPAPSPSPEPTPTPTPEPKPTPAINGWLAQAGAMLEPLLPEATALINRLPPWALPSIAAFLALYALFSTLALRRARRRTGVIGKASDSPTPVIVLPKKPPTKQAVMRDGGQAIACPVCDTTIPLGKISAGRNVCPSCSGAFVCE